MTQPDQSKISIGDNRSKIKELLDDLVLKPRLQALKWAQITKQTPNIKIGYPGQHLASLVTGMPGTRTGARGHDLIDGSETKSCSRVDQVDKCLDCKSKAMRSESSCPNCNSLNIQRNDDSKWLFTLRSDDDVDLLTKTIPRVILALADYPNFESNDFETLSFKLYEIWPQSKRHQCFSDLMEGYYRSIYSPHKAKNPEATPAPKNFWPYSYQFYKCNPVLVFSATVDNANTKPSVTINTCIEPTLDRSTLPAIPMPSHLLSAKELTELFKTSKDADLERCISTRVSIQNLRDLSKTEKITKKNFQHLCEMLPYLDEELRRPLPLRDTNKPKKIAKKHTRI